MRAGVLVDTSFHLPGATSASIAEALVRLVRAQPGHRIELTSRSTYRIVRKRKPAWARSTEECMVEVGMSGGTTVLRLSGRVSARLLADIGNLGGGAQPSPSASQATGGLATTSLSAVCAPAVKAPLSTTGIIDAVPGIPFTAAHDEQHDHTATEIGHTDAGQVDMLLTLAFDTGARVPLSALVLVGRRPEATLSERAAQLVVIADNSVSRTHCAFGWDKDSIWVQDRNSKNGCVAVSPSAVRTACPPGERVPIGPGWTVLIGARRCQLVTGSEA